MNAERRKVPIKVDSVSSWGRDVIEVAMIANQVHTPSLPHAFVPSLYTVDPSVCRDPEKNDLFVTKEMYEGFGFG